MYLCADMEGRVSKIQEFFERIFYTRWREGIALILAYTGGESTKMDTISESGTLSSKVEKTSFLVGAVALITFCLSWLINGTAGTDVHDALRATLISIAAVALGATPFFLLQYFTRRKGIYFVLNTLAVQQLWIVVVLILTSALGTAFEPARTDHWLLQRGSGQGTAAYERTCGLLAANIEIARLTRQAEKRSEAVGRDIRTLISWGPPLTPEDVARREPEIERQIARREAEMAGTEADLDRVIALNRQTEQAEKNYGERYRSIMVFDQVRAVLLVLLGALTSFHVIRGAFLPAKKNSSRLIKGIALLAAWLAAGLCNYALSRVADVPFGIEALRPEWSQEERKDESATPGATPEAKLTALEREAEVLRAEQRDIELLIRRQFLELREICPNVSNRGLW